MAKSKAPRKPYKAKRADIPMMRNTADDIAFRIRAAIEYLVMQPGVESADLAQRALGTFTLAVDALAPIPLNRRDDPKARQICRALDTLLAIEERIEAGGDVVLTDDEAATMRGAAATLDVFLHSIPFSVYQAAERFERQAHAAAVRARQAATAEEARRILEADSAASHLLAAGVIQPTD